MEFHFKFPFLINQFASFLANKKGKNNGMELLGLWLVIYKDKISA